MSTKMFIIGYKNGEIEKLSGENIMDAYSKNGKKTKTGEIDFSILDFYALVPVPIFLGNNEARYQLFVVEEKGKESKKYGHPTNDLNILQKILEKKVKFEKKVSAFIVDLYDYKVISWLWS